MVNKLLSCFTIFLLVASNAFPQRLPDLIPFKKDGKWGYMDKNRRVIIQPKFQQAELFTGDYAFIRLNKKRGTIDKKGNYIISPDHELVDEMPFLEGFIPAKDPKSGLTGYMDKKGQWQIKPQFHRGFHFSNGAAAVLIDEGKNWVIIDKAGKRLNKPRPFWRGSDFNYGLHVFQAPSPNFPIGGQGLLNRYGREIIPPKFFQVQILNSNLIHVISQKSGFADSTGREILPVKYDLKSIQDGYLVVSLNNKAGVIDSTGKFIIPLKYERLLLLGDGLAMVVDSVSKALPMELYAHFINMKDETILPTRKFSGVPQKCKDGFCLASEFKSSSSDPSTITIFHYLMNLKGVKITGENFNMVDMFYEGLAMVKDQNDKIGFIDTTGKEVIKCQYDSDDMESYSDRPRFRQGLCLVSKGDYTFYIDKNGKEYLVK
ncbi:WG repeat-containing protein [Adhaeribacter soli]|uniref:WG repeat-containing protein n=1 Tax=Adhaeribacter soli TaxID=2607655 RepID=A0A5N1J2Y4_9BACT|nr:WG repeat-containing protein [Adhaeribacter soli]KAA9338992.1 WG repeat-containing protein [Adhaeribacter soli]